MPGFLALGLLLLLLSSVAGGSPVFIWYIVKSPRMAWTLTGAAAVICLMGAVTSVHLLLAS